MAAPIAYEQPTVNRSWQAFVSHLPALALVFISTVGISLVGILIYIVVQNVAASLLASGHDSSGITISSGIAEIARLPITILVSLLSVLYVAIPAIHYTTGEVVTPGMAFGTLMKRPAHYLLAGIVFSLASTIGLLLCILPGIAVLLVTPVYVNRIFTTDESISDALSRSFQAVYRSENGWTFIGIQLLVGLCVIVVTICTCGIGGLVAGPMGAFFIMNSAYRQGVLS